MYVPELQSSTGEFVRIPAPCYNHHRYFFSGVDRRKFVEYLSVLDEAGDPAGAMINASKITQPRLMNGLLEYPDLPVVIDSGAFQEKQDVHAYARKLRSCDHWLRKRGSSLYDRIEWAANLDVIGDQKQSNLYWRILNYERDIETLWVYQVSHGDPSMIGAFASCITTDFVGIGGLVPVLRYSI